MNRKINNNKMLIKKVILGLTIIDLILVMFLLIVGRNIFLYDVVWNNFPIYYSKNNIINAFFHKDYFKRNIFEEEVKVTAREIAEVTGGFDYFTTPEFNDIKESVYSNKEFIETNIDYGNNFFNKVAWNYGSQTSFAFIDKETGEVISNEILSVENLNGLISKDEIRTEIDRVFPPGYIQIYDNAEEEGPYAGNILMTNNSKRYIEVYFKNYYKYDHILSMFRKRAYKIIIAYGLVALIILKSIVFLIKNRLNGIIACNKEIVRYLSESIMVKSLQLGVTGGIRENIYFTILMVFSSLNFLFMLRLISYPIIIVMSLIIQIIIFVIYRDKIYYANTLRELDNINEENLHYVIQNKSPYNIENIIKEINLISKGYGKAVDERIKNDKVKTELISNVSHDLKTPLTSIINYINISQRDDITEEERLDFLNIVSAKSKRLKSLVDDLFEAVKLESEVINLDLKFIDILELINQVLGEYEDLLSEKGLRIKFVVKSKNTILQLDGNKMSRVLANIVNNICKYSEEDTDVVVDVWEDKGRVKLSFENCSCYDMEFDEEEIFERFARGDKSRNSKIEGSGLGLAISRNIVKLHSGNISIKKNKNRFKVIISLRS